MPAPVQVTSWNPATKQVLDGVSAILKYRAIRWFIVPTSECARFELFAGLMRRRSEESRIVRKERYRVGMIRTRIVDG